MSEAMATVKVKTPDQLVGDLFRQCSRLRAAQLVAGQLRHPRRLRHVPAMRLGPHRGRGMTDFFEAVQVLSGECVLVLADHAYRLRAGDWALVPPGVRHNESCLREELPYEVLWFLYFDVRLLKIIHLAYRPGKGLRRIASVAVKVSPAAFPLLEEAALLVESGGGFPAVRERLARWLGLLRDALARGRFTRKVFLGPAGSGDTLRANRIRPSCDHIMKHYRERLTIQDIARRSFLSPAYFSSLFKQVYNFTPMDYVNHLRMEQALKLLRETALSVNEVARQVGYEDVLYFRRVFKKHVGLTPRGFRLADDDRTRF